MCILLLSTPVQDTSLGWGIAVSTDILSLTAKNRKNTHLQTEILHKIKCYCTVTT